MDTESDTLNALKVGADDGRKIVSGTKKGKTMDEVKRIQELLEMHCSFRMDGCDCVDMKEKCSACLARHLVGHGVTVKAEGGTK